MSSLPVNRQVQPPVAGAAQVVDRWNTWARVWWPDTDEYAWVNLAEVGWQSAEEGAGTESSKH